jgi:hypothetical protein
MINDQKAIVYIFAKITAASMRDVEDVNRVRGGHTKGTQ